MKIHKSSLNKLPLFLFILIFYVVLVGLRPETAGGDTPKYLYTYTQISTNPLSAWQTGALLFGNTEPLWWPIQAVLKNLFSNPSHWILFNALLIFFLSSKAYAHRNESDSPTFIFLYIFLTYFLIYSGNAMRQAIAIPLLFLATNAYLSSNHKKYILITAIATGLHWSSFFILALPLIKKIKTTKTQLSTLLIVLLISTSASSIVDFLINSLSLTFLEEKQYLYFNHGRISHIESVLKTFNFWLCSTISIGFFLFTKNSQHKDVRYFSFLYLSLIFFGINIPDFSERFLANLLFILPLQIYFISKKIKMNEFFRSIVIFFFFLFLGALVITSDSAKATLGF